MIVQRSRLDVSKLQKIPRQEAALFVLLGHVVNELNVLNKTLYLCSQFREDPEWRSHAHTSQALIFARLLVGKLYEGWELIRKGYFESQISRSFDDKLDSDAKAALANLKRYFGRTNVIETVRNGFSFHYSIADTQATLERQLEQEDMLMYLAENNGNTLYFFSEVIVNAALLDAIEKGDPGKALERLIDESSRVVAWFNELAGGIMAHVVEVHLLEPDGKLVLEPIDIGVVPVAENVEIPYFFTSTQSGDHS